MPWRRAYGGKAHGLAGRSTLPAEAQVVIEGLLDMGLGESLIVRKLRGEYPTITRDKVRTIRLRREGRTHKASVVDVRDAVVTLPPRKVELPERHRRAVRHVLCCRITDCRHPDHELARQMGGT